MPKKTIIDTQEIYSGAKLEAVVKETNSKKKLNNDFIGIRISTELKKQLEEIAVDHEMSVSTFIKYLAKKAIRDRL